MPRWLMVPPMPTSRPIPASSGDAFELRVTLRHIKPTIWRGLRVPAELTLGQLHDVLQIAFGWEEEHMHEFLIGDMHFGMVDIGDPSLIDENAASLDAVAIEGAKFLYRYDFGDGWEHIIKAKRVQGDGDQAIVCTGGARACPPEDCGGPYGYANLLEVLADPKHEEYAEMKEWVGGGFDPEKFNIAAVNKQLAALSKRLGRRRK